MSGQFFANLDCTDNKPIDAKGYFCSKVDHPLCISITEFNLYLGRKERSVVSSVCYASYGRLSRGTR